MGYGVFWAVRIRFGGIFITIINGEFSLGGLLLFIFRFVGKERVGFWSSVLNMLGEGGERGVHFPFDISPHAIRSTYRTIVVYNIL